MSVATARNCRQRKGVAAPGTAAVPAAFATQVVTLVRATGERPVGCDESGRDGRGPRERTAHTLTDSPAPWFAPLLFAASINATSSTVSAMSSGAFPVANICTTFFSSSR